MSDPLCGPSNPLQQFKQQTQLDRTLQQDRLTYRPSPSQGFRSPPANVGALDPEFEAFQAGLPAPDLAQLHSPFQNPPDFATGPARHSFPSWASDFQSMQMSHVTIEQAAAATAAAMASSRGWSRTQDFSPPTQHSAPSPLAFQQTARYGYSGGYQSRFALPTSTHQAPVMSNGKQPMSEQFDEAAFERAFDEAAREDPTMEEGAMSDGVALNQDPIEDDTGSMASEVLEAEYRDIEQYWREEDAEDIAAGETILDEDRETLEQFKVSRRQELAEKRAYRQSAESQEDQRRVQMDFQEQLRLLEMQNLKRLRMAREGYEERPGQETTQAQQEASSVREDPRVKEYLMLSEQQDMKRLQEARMMESEAPGARGALDETEALRDALDKEAELDDIRREEQGPREDDDALAATAHELLEKVQHNQSDKFRNSQFLGLMRQLRDREVRVEGDQMVKTNDADADGATTSLNPTASTSHLQFDNSEQRPSPLDGLAGAGGLQGGIVDTRPLDLHAAIPPHEQDHDAGRLRPGTAETTQRPDGQDVVDLLQQPSITDDIGTSTPFAPSLPFGPPDEDAPKPVYYGDLRPLARHQLGSDLSEMLYGMEGTLSAPK